MTLEIPESVQAHARVSVRWVPAIANQAAPTLAEYNAGQELTCYFPNDWEGLTPDQQKFTRRRMCSEESWSEAGAVVRNIANVVYTYLPQAAISAAGNEVYEALEPDTEGFLVIRYGLPVATAAAAAQKVDVVPARADARSKRTVGEDERAPLVVDQSISARGPLVEDAVLAA